MPPNPVAQQWARARSFHHCRYSPSRLARERARRGVRVSVCLPARECASTVGAIVEALVGLREQDVLDEVVVIDAASADGTAEVARGAGADVLQEAELMPDLGEVLGKGDAMWRGLSVLSGEVICFLDADTREFSPHYLAGLVGPLVCEQPEIEFVKAFYRRPFEHGGVSLAEGGGRVNHLLARPALELFYPQLGEFRQPLAGEVAARRELLERIPFATGYAVEIAMLIDVWREVGLEGMAQVDLEEHRNRHQPLAALTPMARTVLAALARRMEQEGRLTGIEIEELPSERPPLATASTPASRAAAGLSGAAGASGDAVVGARAPIGR
jgi:glucosyl-3-phosphoglycerate synthase